MIPPRDRGRATLRLVTVVAITIAALTSLAAVLTLGLGADRTVMGTLLLYGPRHLVPFGWLLLAVAAAFVSRRAAFAALVAALLSLVLIGGFVIPVPGEYREEADRADIGADLAKARTARLPSAPLRIVTFNVDYATNLGPRLRDALPRWRADVVLLQACGTEAARDLAVAVGRDIVRVGEFCAHTPHRVLAERLLVEPGSPDGRPFALALRIARSADTITVFNVHVMSPRNALSAALTGDVSGLAGSSARRGAQLAALARAVRAVPGPVIAAGDFNTPPPSTRWAPLTPLLHDAFADAGWGFGHTLRAGVHRQRIDFVLTDDAWRARDVHTEQAWPTEHAPVVATLAPQPD